MKASNNITRLEKQLSLSKIKANDYRIKHKTAERRRLVLLEQNKIMRIEAAKNALLIKKLSKKWWQKIF